MTQTITEFVKKCIHCQRYNKHNQKYGHVPPKQVHQLNHWDEVCVDMIGPWKIKINQFEYTFRALTCIDSVINLPEVIPVDNATSVAVANAFEDSWLSRYPFPSRCLHDNDNEFLGPEFFQMLQKNNIKSIPTTIKNPQANTIVERMHQTISTMIAISLKENPPTKFEEVSSLVMRKCKAAQFAIRATTHSTLKFSPGELAFGRNILHPFATQVNWDELLQKKQETVNKANMKENAKRKYFDNGPPRRSMENYSSPH